MGINADVYAADVKIDILSATVKDKRIEGASVTLQRNGAQSVSGTTNASGSINLGSSFADDQDALLIVKKEGYSNLVVKCPCAGMTYAISPVMTSLDGMRVVLSWGEKPFDLDSHLIFPGGHIYFDSKEGTDANLDVDDTDSYGPETVTISKKHFGESYIYAVQDYSNKGLPNSNYLSASKAKVFVYVGGSLVRSYSVPAGKRGNIWTVFKLNPNGEFEDINSVTSANFNDTTLGVRDLATVIMPATGSSTPASPAMQNSGDTQLARKYNREGEAVYKTGQLEQAIQLFQQATELDGNYGQAFSNLGLAYQKNGNIAEAIWANRKAISLASGANAATTRANSYYNIAKIYETAGQNADALQHYQLAYAEKNKPSYEEAIARVKAKM
ncbi:TPA: tetratricopeptide repeat protein [Escherichia coli]|uniref:tetratricopeptide repeat protein n=1 Tax=Escherichia coli TaxID=562 RepID=UPI0003EE7BBF|nr:tetratricopeptide repeat protein [Escherichia coli]HCA7285604.1 tetratricopeptide repeat protein [Escherichia coli O157:H45]ELJ3856080.1 tetratricopeptide repeat protein [Escherichia coli]MBB7294670.1 tetratricopeptide repeat protein [Escherichia coli]MEC4284622.1 tetratricopeptide repeat protein [Escherichia coli]HBC1008765.1 tetratricopeptide repeat protein [Escherichia coli]